MKRISLVLDDMARIRTALKQERFDPVRFGVLAEVAGVNGLVCTFTDSEAGISERDLRLLKELRQTFFNLRIPVQEDAMHKALSLAPDMVTFVSAKSGNSLKVSPIEPELHLHAIQDMFPDLQANDIAVSAFIKPEINVLKSLSKLTLDYVEFDVSAYTTAADINLELVNLDKLNSAAVAAVKLGMGINCSGDIGYEHIPALAKIPNLEDIAMGTPLFQRSLLAGVERAVTEALQLIRYREID